MLLQLVLIYIINVIICATPWNNLKEKNNIFPLIKMPCLTKLIVSTIIVKLFQSPPKLLTKDQKSKPQLHNQKKLTLITEKPFMVTGNLLNGLIMPIKTQMLKMPNNISKYQPMESL